MAKTTSRSRLLPPAGGAVVRMYRIGHGDCFLLAFAGKSSKDPRYVLVDCGYKPGSSKYVKTTAKAVTDDIRQATGGHLHVAVVTHEHQDHVNGITAANFEGIAIDEAWFAWTEDPDDDLANQLRRRFNDRLIGLLAARNRLSAAGDAAQVRRIDRFLAFELGGDRETFSAAEAAAFAVGDVSLSRNKQSMKLLKDRAAQGVRYIRPHEQILAVPGAKNARVFAMGPPRDVDLLESLDPEGQEEFHLGAAARAADAGHPARVPFTARFSLAWDRATDETTEFGPFLSRHYGRSGGDPAVAAPLSEAPSNAAWRRIDSDWLSSAERLALDLNDQTNNASLVLAFELGSGGKVLLFAADAQRGNWLSWPGAGWTDGDRTITARDLLSRTVLYKVGHHGSHNATLNGTTADEHPNLGWMSTGEYGREFTAMITAVRAWAETQDGWDHPLKAIKDALLKRASGRVLQTDTDLAVMKKPPGTSSAEWRSFKARTVGEPLYFDYRIRA
jgi:beta-lactamase superfamily II metal-dependent hydrolase